MQIKSIIRCCKQTSADASTMLRLTSRITSSESINGICWKVACLAHHQDGHSLLSSE
jgi:hypothetical protein